MVARFLSSSTASNIFASSASAGSVIRETVNVQGETSRRLFKIAHELAALEEKLSDPADKERLRLSISGIVNSGEQLVGAMEKVAKGI